MTYPKASWRKVRPGTFGLNGRPGTLRKVTALVSVATIDMRIMNQPTLRPPTK